MDQMALFIRGLGGQAKASQFQDQLQQAGVNLDPSNQSPGDFSRAVSAAKGIYNRSGGAQSSSGQTTYAPDDLRQRAIAAGGAPVTGIGGAQVSANPNAAGGYGFNLSQGARPVSQLPASAQSQAQVPGNYVSPTALQFLNDGVDPNVQAPASAQSRAPVQPQATNPSEAAQPAQTPYEQALARADKALSSTNVITSPDGSRFIHDASGRLQAAGSDPELSAKAAGMKAGAEADAKQTAEDSHKLMTDLHDSSEISRVQSGAISRITDLYKQGATSGFGQPILTQAKSALERAGVNVGNINNQQQLEKELGNLMMQSSKELMKGGGSVSNFERELVQKATANASLTPQANMQILGVLQKIGERNIALNHERVRLDDMGVPSAQIAKELRRMQESMPIGVESLQSIASQSSGSTDIQSQAKRILEQRRAKK